MLGGYESDPLQVDVGHAAAGVRHRRAAARHRGAVAAGAQRERAVPDLPGPGDPHRRAPRRAADAHDGRPLSRRAAARRGRRLGDERLLRRRPQRLAGARRGDGRVDPRRQRPRSISPRSPPRASPGATSTRPSYASAAGTPTRPTIGRAAESRPRPDSSPRRRLVREPGGRVRSADARDSQRCGSACSRVSSSTGASRQFAPPHLLRASTGVRAFLAPHVLAAAFEPNPSRQCRLGFDPLSGRGRPVAPRARWAPTPSDTPRICRHPRGDSIRRRSRPLAGVAG